MKVSNGPESNNEFDIKRFPRMRLPVIDVKRMAHRKHTVHAISESVC
jgi:hypothetical protein